MRPLKEPLMVDEKVITKRVAECAAQICVIAGVRPDGPTGEWIAELVQNCCEEELEEAAEEAAEEAKDAPPSRSSAAPA